MCPLCQAPRTAVQKKGFQSKPSSHAGRVQRYRCRACRRSFSDQTTKLTYRERKPHLNQPLFRLLVRGVSQRACAEILGLHPTTVARKLVRFAPAATVQRRLRLRDQGLDSASVAIFDEMETFEHSKCKPLSIAVAVQEKRRLILAAEVARMPAKGRLAEISRRKYGRRRDDRPEALRKTLKEVSKAMPNLTKIKSDRCPRYPKYVREVFGKIDQEVSKGRRGCVVGQGELKAGGFDPLFSLNHTCAMFRDNLKRLSRRTWCTTKRPDRLQCLVDLYAYAHNAKIIEPRRRISLMSGPIN